MEDDHGVFFHHKFLLAACSLDEDDKKAVQISVDKNHIEDFRKTGVSSVRCVYCHATVKYENFEKHMVKQHEIDFDLEFHVAACFMPEDDKLALCSLIKNLDYSKEKVTNKRKVEEVELNQGLNVAKKNKYGVLEVDNMFLFPCDKCKNEFDSMKHLKMHKCPKMFKGKYPDLRMWLVEQKENK